MLDFSLLDKLREKYKRAAAKYGEKFFDSRELEKRIQNFLNHSARSQSTYQQFLSDEMNFFETIKQKVEEKKVEAERRKHPSRLDEMVEEKQERMRQYPDRFFDPGASSQMRYFIGGFSECYEMLLPAAASMFGGSYLWQEMRQTMADMERFYQPAHKPASLLLKQYGQESRLLGQEARLKLDQKMMQTAGVYLYRFMVQCRQAYDDLQNTGPEKTTLQFSRNEASALRERWNGKTFTQAAREIQEQISCFLNDFSIYELAEFSVKNK